ncbi:glycerophosphodiester phosphodiesterase [Kribbella sandramycini]|nr:glycerophosphodiester phosphodiesterase family protein [Kribbella sandramycini]MBB6570343.1 glycerophosphoryl diester phosphodiesterase [Kribbella sandramycini]
MELGRRVVLAGALGGALGGMGVGGAAAAPAYTLADWVRERGERYLVGHRGVGDVWPEHTMESYQAAVDRGAKAMEISVGITADGVLVCLHDKTLERTTNLTGRLRDITWAQLRAGWVDVPRLGPYWQRAKVRVPLFEDVLRRFGGRVILCVEAKDGPAWEPLLAMVAKYRLERSVMLKSYYLSPQFADWKAQGFGIFAYFTAPPEITSEAVGRLKGLLSPATDAIIVPYSSPDGYLSDELVELVKGSGMPVWPYPLHRRADVEHYLARGLGGAITSNFGYINHRTKPVRSDQWARGAIVPGELTRDPYNDRFALTWRPDGVVELGATGDQHFLTLGNLSPVTAPAYTIEFEAAFPALPSDSAAGLSLAFGHADDRYFEEGLGRSDGYTASLRADGRLTLAVHRAGQAAEVLLAVRNTAAPRADEWMRFRLTVTPSRLIWTRLDRPASVVATDTSYRGGYLHLGRAAIDGRLALRSLKLLS